MSTCCRLDHNRFAKIGLFGWISSRPVSDAWVIRNVRGRTVRVLHFIIAIILKEKRAKAAVLHVVPAKINVLLAVARVLGDQVDRLRTKKSTVKLRDKQEDTTHALHFSSLRALASNFW